MLLLFTTSENVVPAGIASTAGGVSVNVYMVTPVGMFGMDCVAVAMLVVVAPMVLRNVTVMVRVWLEMLPVRAISRFTVKLTLFNVSARLQRHVHREGLRLVVAVDGDGVVRAAGSLRVSRTGVLHR